MRQDIPQGTAGFDDLGELDAACLKAMACLAAVAGSLVGVGVGIGFLIWG